MLNNAPLVSIIVPIYNVEKYLRRCLDSIVNQTYANIHIILIDDGSTDGCSTICDEYQLKDPRITVIHKNNEGVAAARNTGLDIAGGEYISFIDSDDFVDKNYIQELLRAAELNDAEISMVQSKVISCDFSENPTKPSIQNCIVNVIEKYDAIRMALTVSLNQSPWGKLYRINIFNDIRYPQGLIYEDLAVFYNILDRVHRVAVSNAMLYYYTVRGSSYMHQLFNINHYNSLKSADMAMDFVIKNYPELFYQAEARRVYSYFTVLKRMISNTSYREKYKNEILDLRSRIKTHSKGLLYAKNLKLSFRLRLLSYNCNDKVYLLTEKILSKVIERNNG